MTHLSTVSYCIVRVMTGARIHSIGKTDILQRPSQERAGAPVRLFAVHSQLYGITGNKFSFARYEVPSAMLLRDLTLCRRARGSHSFERAYGLLNLGNHTLYVTGSHQTRPVSSNARLLLFHIRRPLQLFNAQEQT